MSSSDTPDLDAKKSDSGSSGATIRPANIKNFVIALIILIIVVIIYFCMSGVNLYLSKLAQANILPTDIHCAPYVSTATASIANVTSNIFGPFSGQPDTGRGNSDTMHIHFTAPADPTHHVLIAPLRKICESQTSHFLAVYFADLLKSMLCFNTGAMNMYYNMLNYIPESMAVAISPAITTIFIILLMIVNMPYFVYTWFKSMSAFFRSSNGNTASAADFKETIDLISAPVDALIAWGFVILFIFILFLVIAVAPLFNFGVIVATWMAALGGYDATYIDRGGHTTIAATVWQVVTDTFKYHKTLISWIFTLLYTLVTFTNLGTVAAIITIVLVIILWVSRAMDFYNTTAPNDIYLGPAIRGVKQAEKTCTGRGETHKAAKGWVGAFIDLFKTPATVPAAQAANPRGGGTTSPISPDSHPIPVLDKRFLKALRGGMRGGGTTTIASAACATATAQ